MLIGAVGGVFHCQELAQNRTKEIHVPVSIYFQMQKEATYPPQNKSTFLDIYDKVRNFFQMNRKCNSIKLLQIYIKNMLRQCIKVEYNNAGIQVFSYLTSLPLLLLLDHTACRELS